MNDAGLAEVDGKAPLASVANSKLKLAREALKAGTVVATSLAKGC